MTIRRYMNNITITENIKLFRIDRSYQDFLTKILTNNEVMRYQGGVMNISQVHEFMEKIVIFWDMYSFGYWIIFLGSKKIGTFSLKKTKWTSDDELDVGVMILKEYRKKGIAKYICTEMIERFKKNLKYSRYTFLVSEFNKPGLMLAHTLGFHNYEKQNVVYNKRVLKNCLLYKMSY